MAKRNYLVEGLSGTGKSSVYEELIRRGYEAVSSDRAWAYNADPDTGLPGGPARHDTFMWDEQKAVSALESAEPEVLFVCGSSRNRDRFLPYFTKVFNLRSDEDTMRRRLEARTEDDWTLGDEGVELMLALNRSDEKPAGAIDVDATRPLHEVVDEVLRLAGLEHPTRYAATVRELRPGVWHWESPHPEWNDEQWWPELVSSYGIELGDDFLLFDPLVVPDELRERATAVVLTAPYHERDARRLGLPVHTPPADTWEDWVEKFGVDPDRVRGMESEDLAWLRAGEGEGHFHGPGAWPFGMHAYPGREDNDLVLWLPAVNAIVTGDSLSDFGKGLDIQLGGRTHVTRDDVAERLRPLLDLPVELVLPAHGMPTDRAELERVLS